MKFVLSAILILAACYATAAAYLYVKQRSFIFFPSHAVEHEHTIEIFELDGNSIHVVVLNPGQSESLLYFGGNAENVVFNAPEFLEMFPDLTLYLVNYRGYAGSSGIPTERGLYDDADAIYRSVAARHTHVAVMGKSLGSGVATYIASHHPVKKLVLVTPYDSIANIAADLYPIFPVRFLLKDRFDSVNRVNSINAQTLIMLAEYDETIPSANSAQLIAAFPESQVSVTTILGANHNSLSDDLHYRATLAKFLAP
ncbi:MAG: alpha/beta hydrolase [Granulosicoccus sp.]|nr:alpha/beta hydrolase [Granulosicoccus sp.]